MANESYTLIVVPHAKARFRKIQVLGASREVGGRTAPVCLVIAASGTSPTTLGSPPKFTSSASCASENKALLTKTQDYEQNASKLQAKVVQLQNMVTKLGVMAGLEHRLPEPVAASAACRAPRPRAARAASMQAMDQSLADLTERSAELEEFYRDQKVLLSSTPSIWPVRGYLSANFGNRIDPFTGQQDFHPGIDISTPIGTKVQAPADGIVDLARPQGGYGNALVIDHGYGVVTRYGHSRGFAVKPGQRVQARRRDRVRRQHRPLHGPHLHYEVWVRDQAQNPIHYILDEYRTFG